MEYFIATDLEIQTTFVVHPHEMFFEAIDLGFEADNPIVVYNDGAGYVVITTA